MGNSSRTLWSAAHRRWRQHRRFGGGEIEVLIEWLAERYSELAFHAGDPCEFTEDGCVDGVTAMEYGLTLDRVLRRSVSCVASDSAAERKMAAFEIADLLEELRGVWEPTLNSTAFFKRLHHPVQGRDLVKEALSALPPPFAGYFQESADQIYGELQSSVLASVWIKSKLTAQGVLVKGRDLSTEQVEPLPEFVANTVRALRNGHHGYVTKRDKSQRPSRYLSLVTGNLPDSMSYLGFLWMLAMLSAPKKMLGWDWMPVNAWP